MWLIKETCKMCSVAKAPGMSLGIPSLRKLYYSDCKHSWKKSESVFAFILGRICVYFPIHNVFLIALLYSFSLLLNIKIAKDAGMGLKHQINHLNVMYFCCRNNSVHAVAHGCVSWWNWQHYSFDPTGAWLHPIHCSNPYCRQKGTDIFVCWCFHYVG